MTMDIFAWMKLLLLLLLLLLYCCRRRLYLSPVFFFSSLSPYPYSRKQEMMEHWSQTVVNGEPIESGKWSW